MPFQRTRVARFARSGSPLNGRPLGVGRLFLAVLLLVLAPASWIRSEEDSKSVVGSWEFPGRLVWVKILPDGRAFQCRIDQHGQVFSSKGKLTSDQHVIWEEYWGTEAVARDGEAITLAGKYTFRYPRATSEMRPACSAPF
jgi:hypothetical protein